MPTREVASKTLQARQGYFPTPGGDSYPLSESATAISLPESLSQLPHLCGSLR